MSAAAAVTAAAAVQSATCRVTVEIEQVLADAALLVPTGVATPYDSAGVVAIDGAVVEAELPADGLEQTALLVRPTAERVGIAYRVLRSLGAPYPEAAFRPRRSGYTVAADDLAAAARQIARDAGGGRAAIAALVAEAHSRFEYAHPEHRFNDGHDSVPFLSCGLTPGSCVDINTYLVAALRAADFEAAYVYGYFFPEERGGITNDMHCWVVTRHRGEILEWDVAHHIKAGLYPVEPALNPRPGKRVAIGHSMGHRYRLPGGWLDLKLLAEPVWVSDGHVTRVAGLKVLARGMTT